MGRIEAAIPRMYCASKRSDLSLIGSAFEATGFRVSASEPNAKQSTAPKAAILADTEC